MNAGMYHEDFSPVGLYVEDGKEIAPLNTADAAGNFFMKPNGVFFVTKDGKVGVQETTAFAAARPDVAYATQSGPMLVTDGNIHPRFEPDGQSRYIRNGVGVDEAGRAVFAISRGDVSLGKFARLYRDALGCRNALFFDGAISALYDGKRYVIGGKFPVGPSVVVTRKLPSPLRGGWPRSGRAGSPGQCSDLDSRNSRSAFRTDPTRPAFGRPPSPQGREPPSVPPPRRLRACACRLLAANLAFGWLHQPLDLFRNALGRREPPPTALAADLAHAFIENGFWTCSMKSLTIDIRRLPLCSIHLDVTT